MRDIDSEILIERARTEYKQAKERIERTIGSLKDSLEEVEIQFRARIEAINWIDKADAAQLTETDDVVRLAIIDHEQQRFTRMDIEKDLSERLDGETPSRGTIVKRLEDLVDGGLLKIVVEGRGRRATEYEKTARCAER